MSRAGHLLKRCFVRCTPEPHLGDAVLSVLVHFAALALVVLCVHGFNARPQDPQCLQANAGPPPSWGPEGSRATLLGVAGTVQLADPHHRVIWIFPSATECIGEATYWSGHP